MKHMIVGLVAVVFGFWGIIKWWSTFAVVLKGFIPFLLLVIGLTALLSGYRRLVVSEEESEDTEKKSKEKHPVQSEG